jgi:predicted ATP-grasp superfamily ATP-dependent carboligase
MNNVFILGVSSPIGLSLIRDLGRNGFTTIGIGNKGAIGHASKYCNTAIVREGNSEGVISQLLTLGGDPKTNFLICISEGDISLINQNRKALSAVFTLLVPEQQKMDIVLDKYKTKEIADTLGIDSPKSYKIKTLADVDSFADALLFPVVLKWANPLTVQKMLAKSGVPLHKLQYAQNLTELKAFLAVYEEVHAYPLIQEYCDGKGLGQFFLCKDGQAYIEFQHERIHEWPPEGGTSTFCRSLPLDIHQDCMHKSKKLLNKLKWSGVAMVEYRYSSEKQKYVLMEINGRFWGSTPLAMYAGTEFASNLVRLLGLQQTVTQPTLSHYNCLYMIPELKRLHRLLFQSNKIEDPNIQFSKPTEIFIVFKALFSFKTKYFVFDFDDPMPFFTDMQNVCKKIFNKKM